MDESAGELQLLQSLIASGDFCGDFLESIISYQIRKGETMAQIKNTILINCARFNCHRTLQSLLRNFVVDVQVGDNAAIKYAARHDYTDIIILLAQYGADTRHLSARQLACVLFCGKIRDKAANKIANWWIPICYNPRRECGRRIAERSWERVEEMYATN